MCPRIRVFRRKRGAAVGKPAPGPRRRPDDAGHARTPCVARYRGPWLHSTFMSLHVRSTAFSTSAAASGWLPVCADVIIMWVSASPRGLTTMPAICVPLVNSTRRRVAS